MGVCMMVPAFAKGTIETGWGSCRLHPDFIKHLQWRPWVYGVLELREQMGRNTSQWTTNPFRYPNATQEQIARLEKRDSAFAHLRKTGDRRPPVDVGAFNQELPGETPQDSDG